MTATTTRWVPISHLQGDAKAIRFDFFTDAAETTPRDVSGFDFSAQIRDRPGASQVLFDLDVDTSNAALGIVVFELLGPLSTALAVREYHWDAQMAADPTRPLTFAVGSWTVEGQVTR